MTADPGLAPPSSMRQVLREGFALVVRFVRAHPVAFRIAVGGATAFAGVIVGGAVVVGRVTDDLIAPVLDEGVPVGGKWLGAGRPESK